MSESPGVSRGAWENYATRVDLLTGVVTGILRALGQNPMIATMAGEDFVRDVNHACNELERLQHEQHPPAEVVPRG